MIIDVQALLSLKGNFVLGVNSNNSFTLTDMVRLKKAIAQGEYTDTYDVNADGLLNQEDVLLLQQMILGQLF